MKSFMLGWKGPSLLLAGVFLLAGSGEAWAWDCRTRTVTRREHRRAIYVGHPYVHVDCDVDAYRPRRVYRTQVVQVIQDDTIVVNVPNNNGSYTPVTLHRSGGGYVGPRGEYYITMPTVDQLKAVYGLK